MGAGSKVIAERTDHPGDFKMYLMGIVNSAFVARRATDHVELVDLSLEKKKAQERYNKEHKTLASGPPRSPKYSASPALEIQPVDLSRETLVPLFLASSVSSDCGDALIGNVQESSDEKNMVGEAGKTEKTEILLEEASSRQLEVDQELPRGDKRKGMKQAGGHTTKTEGRIRVTPKLGRMISNGGVSTRVQRHPLEVIPEQEHSDECMVRAKIDRPARVLQHPLERIDEDSPKERKPPVRRERKSVAVAEPQPGGRKFVRESKMDVKQSLLPKRERAKPRDSRAPIMKPRKPKPEAKDREKPSLRSPVMEKMERLASPEPSWNQKLQNLPTLDVSSEPLMEERELRYSSPKMVESDVQDELSFRVWERESIPKRKSVSVSSDFQDLDLEATGHSIAKVESIVKQIPKQLSPLLTFRATTTLEPVNVQHREGASTQHEYPSPSSFVCELSPTSLFSDDDSIFSKFQQFPEFGEATTTCKSPRSVLSDEVSHFTSDSSETGHRHHTPSSTYNDESSDLESPAAGVHGRSFSMFTYTDKEVELKTAEEEECDYINANGVDELWYFQEANQREPWLEKDGGVLDDTDLEFLLPTEIDPIPNDISKISEKSHPSPSLENPINPKSQNNCVPCDNTATRLPRRHSRSSSKEKLLHPPKRSVKFAPELVQECSIPKPIHLPHLDLLNPKDEDENIYPSVKSWEVTEDTIASTVSPPRRRWLRSSHSQSPESPKCEGDEGATTAMSLRRRWQRCRQETGESTSVATPCVGRLFWWPQRLALKVNRIRRGSGSDDESVEGAESFGRSARRDAQQVRRILKGSQKQFSNLTVADILKDNFQS